MEPADPQHLIPPLENPQAIDPAGDMGLEAGIALHVDGPRRKEAAIAEVAQAGGEAIPQEIKERKDDLGRAGRIRRMFPDGQLGFVITEFIEHIGRVADRDRAHIWCHTARADPSSNYKR